MSLLHQPTMFNNQLNSFSPGHIRSRSYNELLNQFKASISNKNSKYYKKRSHSDLVDSSDASVVPSKRSRTAPPSPPISLPRLTSRPPVSKYSTSLRARSLSPNKRFLSRPNSPNSSPITSPIQTVNRLNLKKDIASLPQLFDSYDSYYHKDREERDSIKAKDELSQPPLSNYSSPNYSQAQSPNYTTPSYSAQSPSYQTTSQPIKLPSISSALSSANIEAPIKLKPIIPTVSLDYPDTYKPNDENWRYELLDSINKGSKNFNLNQYNYLNSHLNSYKSNVPSTSPLRYKPSFDSRISSKITKPTMIPSINQNYHLERKINFPYESNYTYLNKTYLNDVAKYPEYLELAQSLIQLSQPRDTEEKAKPEQNAAQTNSPLNVSQTASYLPAVAKSVPYYSHPLSTSGVASAYKHSVLPPPSATYRNYVTPKYAVREQEPHIPAISTVPHHQPAPPAQNHKFIPITPPSSKSKSRSELLKSPPKHHHSTHNPRMCISCGSDQSPCWRPSWSIKEGQLCNSCGLRYKKTSARCLNKECKKIPANGEWSLMQSKGKHAFEDGLEGYSCLECGWRVEVKK